MDDQVSHERVFLVQDLYVIFPMLFAQVKMRLFPRQVSIVGFKGSVQPLRKSKVLSAMLNETQAESRNSCGMWCCLMVLLVLVLLVF